MKIKRMISQHRRDFWADYECEDEDCGYIERDTSGYDDRNFHDNVAPSWKCKKCGKSTLDIKGKSEFVPTKYNDLEII